MNLNGLDAAASWSVSVWRNIRADHDLFSAWDTRRAITPVNSVTRVDAKADDAGIYPSTNYRKE